MLCRGVKKENVLRLKLISILTKKNIAASNCLYAKCNGY